MPYPYWDPQHNQGRLAIKGVDRASYAGVGGIKVLRERSSRAVHTSDYN